MNGNSQTSARVSYGATRSAVLADYYELAKPSIVWLVLMSTVIGCFLAAVDGPIPIERMLHALLATALLGAGTGALNQWWERDVDSRMRRTASRPIPSGRIKPGAALAYSTGLTVAGLAYLLIGVNFLSFALGAGTVIAYNFIYTPLKTRTWWSTALGAFPGAVPPLLGWAALRNEVGVEAWTLFGILFLWQFPHFYAIAWMYREDYGRAGIRMLPVIEPSGESTHRQILGTGLALVPVSMAPAWLGTVSWWYAIPAFALSVGYLVYGAKLARRGTSAQAKELLKASVLYLPMLYLFLLIARA